MSALVGYDSSDDEDLQIRSDAMTEAADGSNTISSSSRQVSGNYTNGVSSVLKPYKSELESATPLSSSLLGPSLDSHVSHLTLPGPTIFQSTLPGSHYTRSPATLRDLTLPQLPRLDIPPSPAGSPPPGLESKLGQFKTLRNQGVHFNSKLAASSALKNPSLLPRLLTAAGLVEDLQYANTLAIGACMPTKYPDHAYIESLDASQQQLTDQTVREREGRERQFVPAAQSMTSMARDSIMEPGTVKHSKARPDLQP